MMFCLYQPGSCRLSGIGRRHGFCLVVGDSQFRPHFGLEVRPIADVHPEHLGFDVFILVVHRRGTNLDRLVFTLEGGPAPGIQIAVADAQNLIFRDDELGIKAIAAAEDRLAEPERAGEIVDIIIDMPGQLPGLDDPVGAEAVAGFQRDPLAVGENIARGQGVGAGKAIALDFLAAEPVGRVRAKGVEMHPVAAIFGLDAVEGALVAGQNRFIDARLIIAEQRIKLRPFELEIEAAERGGVIALFAAVGVDGIIAARIDHALEAGLVLFLVAVIGQRHQPFAGHPALGVERDAAIDVDIVLVLHQIFEPLVERIEADGAGGKTDHGPGPCAGIEPGRDALGPFDLAIAKGKGDAERAGRGSRCQFDIGDALFSLDPPDRLAAFQTGELVGLLGVYFDRRGIRRGNREVANHAIAGRLAVPVRQPDRDNRSGDAVGDENGAVLEQLGVERAAGIMHLAFQLPDQLSIPVDDARRKDIGSVFNLDAAPGADPDPAIRAFLCPVKGQWIDRLSIDRKLDRLARMMLDGDAQRLYPRIMIFGREQPADARCLAADPVASGARRFRIRNYAGLVIGFGDARVSRRHFFRAEIGAFQGTASAFDEAGNSAAGAARILRTIDGCEIGGEC